jgi:hypothetical protein
MTPNPFPGLIAKLSALRETTVILDGEPLPASVPLLRDMLAAETEPQRRWDLYLFLISECSIADRTAAAARYAAARVAEFGDPTPRIGYARALVADGAVEQGLEQARAAVSLAIERQVLINSVACDHVRIAIRTGSVTAVNQALVMLGDSVDFPRTQDCAFETDWVDAAEALGADPDYIAWAREIAALQAQGRDERPRHP